VRVNVAAGQTLHIVEGQDSSTAHGDVREFWSRYRSATTARVEGRFGEARDAYRAALALDPRHEDVLYYLGNMELELGHYDAAELAWKQLVALNPASARTHSRLGDLYACPDSGALWNLGRAAAEFRRAAELNREETGPLLRLAEVAVLRAEWAAARSHLDAVIVTHPRSVEAHYLRGYVAWKQGRREAAAGELTRADSLARAAGAAQPAQQAPSEGDTRKGMTPLVVKRVRCRVFTEELEPYQRLEARLRQIAALHARGGPVSSTSP
jgi:tetratricopeptide (TPR) repeat protein